VNVVTDAADGSIWYLYVVNDVEYKTGCKLLPKPQGEEPLASPFSRSRSPLLTRS
jgi:hypothetical protein